MKIAILGVNLESVKKAHYSLDNDPSNMVTLYTRDAEAGFSENPPECIRLDEYLQTVSPDWYGNIPTSVDYENESSTSSSWLVKAMSIRLAERGANFLLHTRILEIDEGLQEIHFRGGGQESSGVHRYDELYDFRN
ncbi:MAG: hypothetical protein CMB68_03185 [Euryarchaeota archaeon]|nr:hypothetical protein [Euryarchaeota archaeon]